MTGFDELKLKVLAIVISILQSYSVELSNINGASCFFWGEHKTKVNQAAIFHNFIKC